MVAYGRFYPSGYVGLEQATIRLAKGQDPASWQSSVMLPGEEAVWGQFGISLNAQVVDYCLFTEMKFPPRQMPAVTFDRFLSFLDAQKTLRQFLFAGSIIGEFIDENGRWGYLFPEGWGGDAAESILGRGIADVCDGPLGSVTRLILLSEQRLYDLIANPDITEPPPCRGMDADRSCHSQGHEDVRGAPAQQVDTDIAPRGYSILRTGMAGRPTAKPLILAEMRRRAEVGELLLSFEREAAALSKWAAGPEIGVSVTPKTIKNSLREEYNALKEVARKAE